MIPYIIYTLSLLYSHNHILFLAHKANFTYELMFPSGKGVSCTPRLAADSSGLYGPAYRSQFSKYIYYCEFKMNFIVCDQ